MATVSTEEVLVILAGLIAGMLVATFVIPHLDGGTPVSPDNDTRPVTNDSPRDNQQAVFVSPATGSSIIFMWGIRTGATTLPDGIQYLPEYDLSALGTQEAAVGFVPLRHLTPLLQQNPDIRILPYYLRQPEDMVGIYAAGDSNITTPEDLAGKRLGIPQQGLPMETIEREYNISADVIDVVPLQRPIGGDAAELMDEYSLDAALIFGNPPASLRPIYLPRARLEERFGTATATGVFVISRPEHRSLGEATIDAMNASILAAAAQPQNMTEFLSQNANLPETAFSGLATWVTYREGHILTPMTDDALASLQYQVELYTDNPPTLSSYLLNRTEDGTQ